MTPPPTFVPPRYRPLPSAHSTIAWPSLPGPQAALTTALLRQLDESQWWTPEEMRGQQLRQANALLVHAYRSVPFYRDRLAQAGFVPGRPLTPEVWARIPVLSRSEVQDAGEALISTAVPESHGKTYDISTSGSTGRPVKARGTRLVQLMWDVLTLREHLWQRRDFSGRLAAIRTFPQGAADYPRGVQAGEWGRSTKHMFPGGHSSMLSVATRVEDQAEWLGRQEADYLLTYPSSVRELLLHSETASIRFPSLRQVRTIGEALSPDVRTLCKRVWGLEIADLYSTQEIGYLAFQCPEENAYHVQSETVLLEVLDRNDKACAPGEVGRVVVTSLHNFAMPFIRYAVGDLAVFGEPCPCGRGLPVLKQILGRVRNMLVYPDGHKYQLQTSAIWEDGALGIRQLQIVQHALDDIEIKLVTQRPLTTSEEDLVRRRFAECCGHAFPTRLTYHDEIPRGPSGKFEDFRSEVEG